MPVITLPWKLLMVAGRNGKKKGLEGGGEREMEGKGEGGRRGEVKKIKTI